MKYRKFCIFVLAVSLSGCDRQAKNFQEPIRTSQSRINQPETRIITEVHVHLIQLPEIMKAVFEELDIALERQDREAGRYIFYGQSANGADVTIEAASITKGSTLLKIGAGGEDIITEPLLKAIDKAIEKAINEKNRRPTFSGANNAI